MPAPATPQAAAPRPAPAPAAGGLPRPYLLSACIAGVFLVLVGGFLVARHLKLRQADPLNSPQLTALKQQLQATPQDEALKKKIRDLDLQLRRQYFEYITSTNLGAWLLVGGLGVFVVTAAQLRSRARKQLPPRPTKEQAIENEARAATRLRWSVAGMGVALGVVMIGLASQVGTRLPASLAELDKPKSGSSVANATTAPAEALPSAEEWLREWPQFRGPQGNGFTAHTNLPTSWDIKSDAGILWKTPVPVAGFNSPVVWGDHAFLSGGDKTNREVCCFKVSTGELLWRKSVQPTAAPPAGDWDVPELSGIAASTMAVDGRRAYAIFGNGDLAAFDFTGKQVWVKSFGPPNNSHGHATSLVVWQGRLIVQLDQGEIDEKQSKLYAFDGATGKVIWEKPRPAGSSWASPIVQDAAGKPQILALAVPFIISYAATDGSELWRIDGLNGEVTPSPAFGNGMFLVASPSEKLFAIKPDGQGDVTKTHVAWTAEENVPDISSPVSNGELVFTASTAGLLTCYDIKDGKKLWEKDFETECQASPIIAGNHLYLFSTKGLAVVLEAGREFKELARSEMGDPIFATPAFQPGRMIIRTTKELVAIGEKKQPRMDTN